MKGLQTISAVLWVGATILSCGHMTSTIHRTEANEGIPSLASTVDQENSASCPQPTQKRGLVTPRDSVIFNFPDGAFHESDVVGGKLAFVPDISEQRRRLMLKTPELLFPVLVSGNSELATSSTALGLAIDSELHGVILGRGSLPQSFLAQNKGRLSSFFLIGLDSLTPAIIESMSTLADTEIALSLCDSTPLTDELIARMSEKLVALHLRDCAGLGEATALEKLGRLEIIVARGTGLDDHKLKQLASGTFLQALDLANTSITDDGLTTLSELEQLQVLDLSGNRNITDRGMSALRSLTNLHTLDVSKTEVSDQGLAVLAERGSLQTLAMNTPEHWSRLSSTGLFTLLRSFEIVGGRFGHEGAEALKTAYQLESLTFREVDIDGESLALLAALPALSSLRIESSRVSNSLFSNIESWPALVELKLNSTQIERALPIDQGMPAKLRTLQWLDAYQQPETIIETFAKVKLSRFQVEAENRGALLAGGELCVADPQRLTLCPAEILGPRCEQLSCTKNAEAISLCALEGPSARFVTLIHNKNLEELFVGWMEADDEQLDVLARQPACTGLVLEQSSLSQVGYSHLSRLHRLRGLSLAGTSFDDRAASVLSDLPDLQILNLGETKISGHALTNIQNGEGLIGLELRGAKMNRSGFDAIVQMTNLRTLDLSKTSISRTDLERLSKLPALRSLRLAFTPIGDESASPLAKMRSLVALDLTNTRVTDQILATLAQLPELRTLGLEGTKVSLEAIREFKRQNPRIEVLELQSD